jgi:hypothetical protein
MPWSPTKVEVKTNWTLFFGFIRSRTTSQDEALPESFIYRIYAAKSPETMLSAGEVRRPLADRGQERGWS